MDYQDDKKLTQVRLLLAKAEKAATAAEAEAYTAKAAELIAKYGIDEALLAATDPAHNQPGDLILIVDDPYAYDKCVLAAGVADGLRVTAVQRKIPDLTRARRRWQYQMHLFGMPADLRRAELLFTSLLVQMMQWGLTAEPEPTLEDVVHHTLYRRFGPIRSGIRGDQLAAYRRSWMQGFSWRINQRLHELEEAAKQRRIRDEQAYAYSQSADALEHDPSLGGPGVALVLVDQQEMARKLAEQSYPDMANAAPRKLSGRGGLDGVNAANQADLGQGAVGWGTDRPRLTGGQSS